MSWTKLTAILMLATTHLLATDIPVRSGPPGVAYIVGATVGPPAVLQTMWPHSFTAGQQIGCWNIAGALNLNGHLKIKAVPDNTHFSVTDLAGVDITASGVWQTGGTGNVPTQGQMQWCGVETNLPLATGIRGWFDGDNGPTTRSWVLGTANGLVSLTVDSSHIAHVTAPSGYGAAISKISVWGSGNSTLNNGGTPYTITIDSSTTFHFTVSSSIPAATYSGANKTCGPSSNADCLRLSQHAFKGDPFWDNVVSTSATYAPRRHKFDGGDMGSFDPNATNSEAQLIIALKYFVDQSDTTAKASVKYWLLHHQRIYTSAGWGASEVGNNGDNSQWAQYANYILRNLGIMYAIGHDLLTSQQQQDFCDQFLNGWDARDLQYVTKTFPLVDSGTATFNGTQWVGSGTHWLRDIHPCDSYGCDTVYLTWHTSTYPYGEYYVTSVVDDTHITVDTLNAAPVGTPTHLTILHHWVPGVAGLLWAKGFWSGAFAQQLYWPNKDGAALYVDRCCFITSQNGSESFSSLMFMASALADKDPRAIDLFSMYQSLTWDAIVTDTLGGYTGFGSSGVSYNADSDLPYRKDAIWAMQSAVPSISLPNSAWARQNTLYKIYATTPELYGGVPKFANWGFAGGSNWFANDLYPYQGWNDASFMFAPQSTEAQALKGFFAAIKLPITVWGLSGNAALGASPGTPVGSFTNLPHQRLFTPTNKAEMTSLTGTLIPQTMSMDAVVSTGCWTFPSDCTHLMFLSMGAKGSDYFGINPSGGDLHVFKRQPLLEPDDMVPGQLDGPDTRLKTSMIDFVGVGLHARGIYGDWAINNIIRWHGPDNGGDPANNVVYATAETKGQYIARIDRAQQSIVHFKKPGTEEVVINYIDIDQTSANPKTPFRHQIHYSQNGEAGTAGYVDAEGNTTCPGSGGCANIDANRTVLSQQSGLLGNIYGVVTKFFTPSGGSIFIRDDGSQFSGGLGHSHRVSIFGGASATTTPNAGDWVEVHKISQNMSDTTFTATAINPDANWTGVQTADKVALFARGGVLRSSLTSFTTTHSGTAQYLIAGLKPGSYAVTVGGTPVSGSPFSVTSSRDTAINFESTAGVVALSGTPTGFSVTTSSLASGQVGVPYTTTLTSTGGTGSVTWKIVSGLPCEGLFLNATTGVYAGTPTRAQVCNPTFSATDSSATPITVDSPVLNATISSGAALNVAPTSLTYSCQPGGSAGSQNVTVGASGVTLDNWSATKLQPWVTLSSANGSAAGTIGVAVSCVALAAGSYSDTISIGSTTGGITNSPQTVTINLTVASLAVLTVSPNSFTFSCESGGMNPASQSLAIGAASTTLDNFTATKSSSWLTLSPTSGSAAGNVIVSANCSGQTLEAHTDTIVVASTTSGISNSPVNVGVTLNVSPARPTGVSGNLRVTGNTVIH